MATYAVDVSRCESSTIHVEADSEEAARELATSEADSFWEADTRNLQIDSVRELTADEADRVSSYTVRADA